MHDTRLASQAAAVPGLAGRRPAAPDAGASQRQPSPSRWPTERSARWTWPNCNLPTRVGRLKRRDGTPYTVTGVSVTVLLKLAGLDLSQNLGAAFVVPATPWWPAPPTVTAPYGA
jgi:hypothetical protein